MLGWYQVKASSFSIIIVSTSLNIHIYEHLFVGVFLEEIPFGTLRYKYLVLKACVLVLISNTQLVIHGTGKTKCNLYTTMEFINQYQACKSHDLDHQWTDYAMVWLPQNKRKRENKVARLVWDFDCLHFAQYILISPHVIDCKQSWCKKIYPMDRVSWLKPLSMCYSTRSKWPNKSPNAIWLNEDTALLSHCDLHVQQYHY